MVRRKKRRNPGRMLTVGLVLSASVLAVGAGYAAYQYMKGKGKKGKKAIEPKAALQGVLGQSTLEDAKFMLEDIAQPILLQSSSETTPFAGGFDRVPKLEIQIDRPAGETTIETPAGAVFGPEGHERQIDLLDVSGDFTRYSTTQKAIAYVITGLSAESSQLAYELLLIDLDQGLDWSDPSARDAATATVLSKIASGIDWSRGMEPYAYGGPESQAWVGVQIVGAIAHQSFYNKRAFGGAA